MQARTHLPQEYQISSNTRKLIKLQKFSELGDSLLMDDLQKAEA